MTERRIVMFNQVSADGFFSDAQGGLDWVVNDPEVHARAVQGMPETDAMLLGRRTYDNFAAFWPHALENLEKPGPHGENKADPAFAAMARWLHTTKKLVPSRTAKDLGWNNTELLPSLTPERIQTLKRQLGKDILIFGSGSVVTQLSEHGLIDEYRFVVCPVLLGSGKSLLQSASARGALTLIESQAFRSGNVMLTYRPSRR